MASHLKYSDIYCLTNKLSALVIAPSSLNYCVIFLNSHPISDSYLMILFVVSLTLISGLKALNPLLSVKIKSVEIFWKQYITYLSNPASLIPCSREPLYLIMLSCYVRKEGLLVWFRAVLLKLGWVWFKFDCIGFLELIFSFSSP